jgi:hypothetical protein
MKTKIIACALSLASFALAGCAHAPVGSGASGIQPVKDRHAMDELKVMSGALAGAKTLSFDVKAMSPLRGPNGQWLHMMKSAQVKLERPDHLRISQGGDAFPQEVYFDGKTFSVEAPQTKLFTQQPMPGTIDQMLANISKTGGESYFFSDVLLADPFGSWEQDLTGATYVGESNYEGKPLHHLAFTSKGVDWEVFVSGEDHLPRVVFVKYLNAEKSPTVQLEFSNWKVGTKIAASTFKFKAPEGSKQASFKAPKGAAQ